MWDGPEEEVTEGEQPKQNAKAQKRRVRGDKGPPENWPKVKLASAYTSRHLSGKTLRDHAAEPVDGLPPLDLLAQYLELFHNESPYPAAWK